MNPKLMIAAIFSLVLLFSCSQRETQKSQSIALEASEDSVLLQDKFILGVKDIGEYILIKVDPDIQTYIFHNSHDAVENEIDPRTHLFFTRLHEYAKTKHKAYPVQNLDSMLLTHVSDEDRIYSADTAQRSHQQQDSHATIYGLTYIWRFPGICCSKAREKYSYIHQQLHFPFQGFHPDFETYFLFKKQG